MTLENSAENCHKRRAETVVAHRSALTRMRKDRTMAKRPLPTPEELRQLLDYDPETGKLFWKERPLGLFPDDRSGKIWNTRFAGREAFAKQVTGYLQGGVWGTRVLAHRAAWAITHGRWPDAEIDHINGKRDDNRILNLRAVSHQENCRNSRRPSNNTSGHVGVIWCKRSKRWVARISMDKKIKHVGAFRKKLDAIAARKQAEQDFCFHANHGRF